MIGFQEMKENVLFRVGEICQMVMLSGFFFVTWLFNFVGIKASEGTFNDLIVKKISENVMEGN